MNYQLKIEIQSYWHPGTGRGQGADVDAVTHRNAKGLPILPGRTLKGLLRDAVARWESVALADQLFGPNEDGKETWPGLLRISDAGLPAMEAEYLARHKELLQGLFRSLHSTAVEHDTGTAKNQSLRGMEVVVPLTLYADIDTVANAKYAELSQWADLLKPALSLIHAVGAHRSRGLGRAVITLEERRP
jgi:CRISPR/Cas system CSM-associated protein Csm3 (group 7 of RAMP superfamily)